MTVFCIIGLCGDISKACLNPAVGTAVPFFHAMYASTDDPSNLDYVICYMFGPVTGGIIATQIMTRIAFHYPNEGPSEKKELQNNKIYSEIMLMDNTA